MEFAWYIEYVSSKYAYKQVSDFWIGTPKNKLQELIEKLIDKKYMTIGFRDIW